MPQVHIQKPEHAFGFCQLECDKGLKTLFCVHEDELFMSADELFLVNGQTPSRHAMSCLTLYNDFDQVNFTSNLVCIAQDSKLRHSINLVCCWCTEKYMTFYEPVEPKYRA